MKQTPGPLPLVVLCTVSLIVSGALVGCGGYSRTVDEKVTMYTVLVDERVMPDPFDWEFMRSRVDMHSAPETNTLDFGI